MIKLMSNDSLSMVKTFRCYSGMFYPEVRDMDMKKIESFISELRKEKGLTQEQLGEKLGVTNKTVSGWERGTYLPPAGILLEI